MMIAKYQKKIIIDLVPDFLTLFELKGPLAGFELISIFRVTFKLSF